LKIREEINAQAPQYMGTMLFSANCPSCNLNDTLIATVMIHWLQLVKEAKSDCKIRYFLKCKLQLQLLRNYNSKYILVATANDTLVATRQKSTSVATTDKDSIATHQENQVISTFYIF
jgi:hypothetical protein